MKIELELNIERLNLINSTWNQLSYPFTKYQKVKNSILQLVAEKLIKKALSKRNNEPKKKIKISLQYFEAYYLEDHLRTVAYCFHKSNWQHNTLYDMSDQLNQKLA